MGFLDRLLGRDDRSSSTPTPRPSVSSDEAAIERYRYLLRTAPPEALEQAHAEAFARLTPQQRAQVLAQLGAEVEPAERAASDDPKDLARMATRAELRRPGTLERSFGGGGMGGGFGMGGVIAGSLLAGVAGAFVGTAIADAMFDGSDGSDASGGGDGGGAAEAADSGSADAGGFDSGYDAGGFDGGGFDGGGFGDFGA